MLPCASPAGPIRWCYNASVMNSWWELGEATGLPGTSLQIYEIECPFCSERGKFQREFHAEKKKPNSDKRLNFDTLKCANCMGYVQVLWSAGEITGQGGVHDYRVQPWPLKVSDGPEHWPSDVRRCWQQAHKALQSESWDAAAMMARSALQAALRDGGASGNNLKGEIASMANQGVLPPLMKEWSEEVRELGNEASHPAGNGAAPLDAGDIVQFLDYLLQYLYDLPKAITGYRQRRKSS